MPFDPAAVEGYLREFEFGKLFNELGWDRPGRDLDLPANGRNFRFWAVAQKRGFQVFACVIRRGEEFPDYSTRRKLERQVARQAFEHLLIFADEGHTRQKWLWARRTANSPLRCHEHDYARGQPGDSLVQKLQHLAVSLDEEEGLTLVDVSRRTRQAFDAERVTKKFYERFKREHGQFLSFIQGIEGQADREWYASLMLNRLMFVYFIQKKRFLDDDPNYLRRKLREVQQHRGKDKFLSFYRHFLLRLFHEGLGRRVKDRPKDLDQLLGKVPYLNGELFDVHELERGHPDIKISDEAFEKLFDFFDAYQWHLDERPLRADNEINPDVLGYIFEKYINAKQKEMGAYYTKEDITGYIARNTILPSLLAQARKDCDIAFRPDSALWKLLRDDPDRYLYPAVRKSVDLTLPPEIAAGLDDVSRRDGWNRPAAEGFALPTETWREHIARRKRCQEVRERLKTGKVTEINDLVTLNLDVRQFAEDVIENSEGPDLLRALYQAISRLSVLDPTCGSGAFLFAALNILEPLYDACLDRMQAFVDEADRAGLPGGKEKFADFRGILKQVEAHPGRRYFILKSVIINNLYGVDLMDEAVEICKLRLFLKLVAQVDKVNQLEPLPDIDFNVRAGNTLVGFATLDEVRKALKDKIDFEGSLGRILADARRVDEEFQVFRRMQVDFGPDTVDFKSTKGQLRRSLDELRDVLDRVLATEYGLQPEDAEGFESWHASHRPFHWFAEFYGIMSAGGFDAIIGNPPYVQLSAVSDYRVPGYTCKDCGNLYPLVLERCGKLSPKQGRQGFIVPVSSISTEGYASLQKLLRTRWLAYSSYDDRPSRLFEGLEHIRLTIHLIGEASDRPPMYSTQYHKWNRNERALLFDKLSLVPSWPALVEGSLPKWSSPVEQGIVDKLRAQRDRLANYFVKNGPGKVYYSRKVGYFVQILDFQPEVYDGGGRLRAPSEFKELRFESETLAGLALCCLNANLFYWFVTVYSDCRHVNRREIDSFPVDLQGLAASPPGSDLKQLAPKLMNDLRAHSERRTMSFKHDTLTVQCIIPKLSKPLLDEIDRVLARHYRFTDEELDFVLSYDVKYRMGQDAAEDEG